MPDYYVIATNIGEAKMANALALGIPLAITELALGDGEGAGARGTPVPNPEATALISERRRAPVNSFSVDPNNDNVLIAEQVIPETAGGWWIREMGLFDEDGDLIFVCNTPPTYKPQLSEGSGRTQVVRMAAIVSNTASVTLKVDPSVILATREYVQELVAVQATEFESMLNNRIAQSGGYNYTQMGKALDSNDTDSPINDNAAMWPHATVDYDPELDKFVVFYNINSGHSITQCSVLMAKKPVEGGFETPTIVASEVGTTSYKVQAAGIAPNGDYIALVGVFNWGGSLLRSEIFRSIDKGSTWTSSTMQDAATNTNIVAYNGDVTGFLKLSSGRILTLAVEPGSMLTRIYYSDDNAGTWNKASITGGPSHITEPAWAELPNGTIICMARAGVAVGSVDNKIPAKFMKSTDGGLTWSAPVDSSSITEMTLSNGHMLVFEDDGFIEFLFHSRYAQPDGYASLYVSRASFDDAENDQFSEPQRIGKLAPQNKSVDGGVGDAGYVGAAVSSNGVINAFYYTGTFSGSQISQLVGRKVVAEEREYFIDYNTGFHKSASMASVGLKYVNPLYKNGEHNEDLNIPVIEGLVTNTSTVFMRERDIYLDISAIGARAGVTPDGGIFLTDIDTLYCHYQGLGSTGDADFGIFLYNKPDPVDALDGRVAFAVGVLDGWETVALDVSGFDGLYYPQYSLNSGISGEGTGTARITEIGLLSSSVNIGSPSDGTAQKNLYTRGTQLTYISGAWAQGFMDGTANASFEPDHIAISASGDTVQGKASVRTGLLDLTNADYLEITFDGSISNTDNSDFGLALYDTSSADGTSTNRLTNKFIKNLVGSGAMKMVMDVKAFNSGYLYIVANAATTGTGASTVEAKILSCRIY